MVATVDDMLLFYDVGDYGGKNDAVLEKNLESNANKKYILDYLSVKQRQDTSFVDIIESIPGFFNISK